MAALVTLGGCSSSESATIAPTATGTVAAVGGGPCGTGRADPLRLEPLAPARPAAARPTYGREPLGSFYDALTMLERRQTSEPVSVLILGDSHMAGHFFAGRVREKLQARFGSAGPGAIPGRATHRAYRNPLAEVQQAGNWAGVNSLRPTTPGPFGLSFYRLRAEEAGSTLVAAATEPAGFDRLTASVVRLPDGGGLRVSANGCVLGSVATAGDGTVALVADLPRGTTEVSIETTGGPVELIGWRLTRGRGLLVENHGVNGAQLAMLSHVEPEILAAELRRRDPALIVLAFGTNEAFAADFSESRYRALVTERVDALRRAVPRASILIVGPPDSAVPSRAPAPARGRKPVGCRWQEPPSLAPVKAALRQAAAELGVAYWDWSKLTRGACGVDAMTKRTPPLAQADHVHFTADGYVEAADQFARFLTDGYARRRKTS
ncbi:lysophospholipase L1-like esterase [Stella humosa]|uniref:Lysophospholipase L1-like esterase n=2 Tax=Stella humosa TaxID=94 RepID=A0A3N1L278_9PROT|nr:lysophospholipase L1-like esterase [Stella humosa]